MVPSSIAVTIGLATTWPILPVKTVDPLPTKSASSPCPQASWNSTPPNSLPMMTAIWPEGDGPLRGRPRILGGRRVIEEFEATLHAGRLHRGLDLAVSLGDSMDHQADAGAGVRVMDAFRGGDQHVLRTLSIAHRYLFDGATDRPGGLVRFEQQLDLCFGADPVRWDLDPLRL